MIKRFLFAIITLLLIMPSFAQLSAPLNSISVSGGGAFPVGSFSKTDLFNKNSGFATAGPSVSVLYTRKIASRLRLSFEALGQFNATDTKGLEDALGNAYFNETLYTAPGPGNPPGPNQFTRYQNWKIEKESWSTISFLLGAQYDFPLNKTGNSVLYARASIGAIYANSPGLEGASITDTATCALHWNRGSGWGAAYALATGIRQQINEKLFLTAGVSYAASGNVKFKDAYQEFRATRGQPGQPDFSIQESILRSSYSTKITNLNISLGLGTQF